MTRFRTSTIIRFISARSTAFNTTSLHKVRKPLLVALSALFLIMLVISACTTQPTTPSSETIGAPTESAFMTSVPSSSSTQEPVTTSNSTIDPSIEERAFAFIDPYIDEAIALIDADRRQLSDVTFAYEPKLLYDILRLDEKAMYDEILRNVQSLKHFSYTPVQHISEAFNMVMLVCFSINVDHPEIENYFMLRDVIEGNKTSALESLYFMPWDAEQQPADPVTLRKEIRRFDAVSTRIAERMPDDYSAYDKYRYLASVISLITSYDHDNVGGWQVSTAYGAIMSGCSICQGYSRGFLYLCQKANLWCETVEGVAGENIAHMWNIVKLDSGTYFVDVTWCDEAGLPGSPDWNNYFMLTQDEILVDHEIIDCKVATGTGIR